MEIYYNKKSMNDFIDYVTDNMKDNNMSSFVHDFRLSVFEHGLFLLNAPIEQACSLFADLTFCHIIINNNNNAEQINNMKCVLKNIIEAGLQKFNLYIN